MTRWAALFVLGLSLEALAADGGSAAPAAPDESALALPADQVDGGTPAKPAAPARPPLRVDKLPFTEDSIKQVVRYHEEEIQACYEKTLADNKVVEGKLTTSFVITKEGKVKEAKVLKKGTTLREPRLHACVVETLSAMAFPKPHDKRDHPVEYPFNLKAVR